VVSADRLVCIVDETPAPVEPKKKVFPVIRVRHHGRGHYRVMAKRTVRWGSIFLLLVYLGFVLGHASMYNEGVNVCRHMARDAEDILERWGFDVKLYSAGNGPVENGSEKRHMWLCVNGIHFDSVTLLPFYNLYTFHRNDLAIYDDYQEYLDIYYQEYGVYPDPVSCYPEGG